MVKRHRNISTELCDQITVMVSEGKNDRQIAEKLSHPVKYIRDIRADVLHISLYGQKRKCDKCKQLRVNTCFKEDHQTYPGWCIICRRKAGVDHYIRKPRTKTYPKKEKTGTFLCLHCDKPFISEIWGLSDTHFYLCIPCRKRAICIDQVSMYSDE